METDVMKLPQEIEVWYVIPAIRREFAKGLIKKGLKQREVARMLGVTDAAVSQYFSSKRGSEVRFNQRIKREVKSSIEKIIKGSNVMKEIQTICRLCKEDQISCYIHKHHGAPKNCRVCFPD
jgi:predicted transcriptional regulator